MASNRERGNAKERQARAELEARSYLVERCNPKLMRLPGGRVIAAAHDYFGAFDLVAQLPWETRWIQVTIDSVTGKGSGPSARRQKIEALVGRLDRRAFFEVWSWQPRRPGHRAGWRIQRLQFDSDGGAVDWYDLERPA